jgi:pyruvate formate lyase activating enzyme
MDIIFRKTSLIDYPGKIASALFFAGCNLRCPWCHNRDLVLPDTRGSATRATLPQDADQEARVSLDTSLSHIEKRRAVLGGVVLSGGEPTLYHGLPGLIQRIKALGLLVKLDTNGMSPSMLESLLQMPETSPDYIALDLKTSPDRYASFAVASVINASPPSPAAEAAPTANTPAEALKRSAAIICASGIAHEFRTLALPSFTTEKDIEALAELVDDAPWYVRAFRPGNCLDPAWDDLPPSPPGEADALVGKIKALGKHGINPDSNTAIG